MIQCAQGLVSLSIRNDEQKRTFFGSVFNPGGIDEMLPKEIEVLDNFYCEHLMDLSDN